MNIVLRQARIIDPSSPHNGQVTDILIEDGIIKSIGAVDDHANAKEIIVEDLNVSPGWLDVFSHFCDPGFEYRETLETGAAAAAAGGFTDVFVLPNTSPYLHNKAAVEYVAQKGKQLPVTIHPIAGITKNGEGKELAEMYDMYQSGAVAFGDGLNTIQSGGLLLKALQYLKAIDATIIQLPDDKTINANGLMHEGIVSTTLGLPGKPAIAEELMIVRDIELAKYTDSKIHFTGISTAKSLALIAQAKKDGIKVTCSITPYHLLFCDEDVSTYDTNLKANPPLRTKEDRAALQAAVLDGTIDAIASHHNPHNIDEKLVEFEYAKDGMISLQTAYSVITTALPQLPLRKVVELLSINPRKIFNLPLPSIKEGEKAVLSLFSKSAEDIFTSKSNLSKSFNSPFVDKTLKGKALGIINKDRVFLRQ